MSTSTAADSEAKRKELEQSAALVLGKILFAFSRLDMNLGLMLAWMLWETGKERQAKDLNNMNFNSRLELLGQHIESSTNLSLNAKRDLNAWLAAAHQARKQRNQLVHGRWGTDALKSKVLNVVGLPSSDEQETIEYSLDELDAYKCGVERLTLKLSRLRERWKLA